MLNQYHTICFVTLLAGCSASIGTNLEFIDEDAGSDGGSYVDAQLKIANTIPPHQCFDWQDTDQDGISNLDEDPNCNGNLDPNETSPDHPDTDHDGASDLVEITAGTDPTDGRDNPQANGDFVFVMPYMRDPSPQDDDLSFSTDLKLVDLYLLVDLSASMRDELSSIRRNMAAVVKNLTCKPNGTGLPGQCIQNLWAGVGTFTYLDRNPFVHRLDVQPNPDLIERAVPDVDRGWCPRSGCTEPYRGAVFSAASGRATCGARYSSRTSCAGSPAGASGVGYPCFRPDALPIILVATDEPDVTSCPSARAAAREAADIGAKVIGIRGEGPSTGGSLIELARLTGAVDTSGTPLVRNGAGSRASAAIEDAIRTLSNNVHISISGHAKDDPSDDVDTVDTFIDHIETLQINSPECTTGLPTTDTDGDGYPDVFTRVVAGTPVCWKVVVKQNTTVQVAAPSLYRATVSVVGDNTTLLDKRDVFFIVPPTIGLVQ